MLSNRKKANRRAAYRLGSATVECALVMPLLLFLLVSTLEVGQFISVSHVVDNASREGARVCCKNDTASTEVAVEAVRTYLINSFSNVSEEELTAATTVVVTNSADDVVVADELAGVDSGLPVTVEVTFDFDTVRWGAGFSMLQGANLRTRTVMRRQ